MLSEGALSGEYALDTELMHMHMVFEFDFTLVETIPVPDAFLG